MIMMIWGIEHRLASHADAENTICQKAGGNVEKHSFCQDMALEEVEHG
jgi:hypothetical protein